jgi:nitrile hydratase subunit beta
VSYPAGQPVRARLHSAPGHTRLPLYVRGRPGVVFALRGHFPLADELARHGTAAPEALYSVRFAARDLWGDDAGDHDIYLDLFESYLTHA